MFLDGDRLGVAWSTFVLGVEETSVVVELMLGASKSVWPGGDVSDSELGVCGKCRVDEHVSSTSSSGFESEI